MFDWLNGLLRGRETLRKAPHISAVAQHNHYHQPVDLFTAQNQAKLYQQSPWVYIAISRIAEAAALVPLQVQRLEGEKRIEVERHPLERLLDAPNPYMSRFELFEQTVGTLELSGNAYWFLAGDGLGGPPTQIWPLRPDRVTIVPDAENYVKGYVYEVDGLRIPLEPVEVVHFKRWHPSNDYYGLSALDAARLSIQSDQAMARWNHNSFGQDNGVPAGIVKVEESVSDADFERIKREWRQSYGGPQRRTAFLRGSGISWQDIGLSHSELDFLRGREAHRNEILNIFGIPVGLLSENATEANAKVAERTFIERTLYPKLVRLEQKITQSLLAFWEGEYVATFEDIRPTDVQTRLAEIQVSYPVLSINEIRERYYQLPAVSWGEGPAHSTVQAVPSEAETPAPQEATDPADEQAEQLNELGRWERFTLKRWGQASPVRPFRVEALPVEMALDISAGLLGASDVTAAQAVFRQARETLKNPLHQG